jgi:hypothetical protein
MGHPQLWWLLIAPRRDAQTFAVQKPRNEAIKQLILCPTIYVTTKPGSNWGPKLGFLGRF